MFIFEFFFFFFFQAEDGIRDSSVTGVQTLLFRSGLVSVSWRRHLPRITDEPSKPTSNDQGKVALQIGRASCKEKVAIQRDRVACRKEKKIDAVLHDIERNEKLEQDRHITTG